MRQLMRLSRSTAARAWALAVLAILLAACQSAASPSPTTSPNSGSGPGDSPATAAVRVVTTTTIFADIVHAVGGDRVTVTSIIPAGVGPEDYEPKPDDARRISDATLIVSNGVGLDDFLENLIASGAAGQTPRLVLGEGIPALTVDGEPNPHFWLDPTLVKHYYLPAIVKELSTLDPAGAATYQANANDYGANLDALDAELKAKIQEIPQANRKLVTFHDAFPYFARHYGFEIVGVMRWNVDEIVKALK